VLAGLLGSQVPPVREGECLTERTQQMRDFCAAHYNTKGCICPIEHICVTLAPVGLMTLDKIGEHNRQLNEAVARIEGEL
jgi:hypothetical protein